jgi:hypothetical protein
MKEKLKAFIDLAILKLFKVLLILGTTLGLHFALASIPLTDSGQTRYLSNMISGCKMGWFSESGVCQKYIKEIIHQNEMAEADTPQIYPCGSKNENCQITGVMDNLYYLVMIVDFLAVIMVARLMGLVYRANVSKETKRLCWIIFLLWNTGILFLMYMNNKFVLFPGDLLRQIVEIIAFAVVFKINTLKLAPK